MTFSKTRKKIHFFISIATLVTLLVMILTGLYLWNTHRASSIAALSMADRLFEEINGRIEGRYHRLLGSVNVLTTSCISLPDINMEPEGDGLTHPLIEFMKNAIVNIDHVISVYSGYESGSFLQVIAVRGNPDIIATYSAPQDTRFIVRSISVRENGQRVQHWSYLDSNERTIDSREEVNPLYDPRNRPWYDTAIDSTASVFTDPYIFDASKEPGITCSRTFPGKTGVVGVDITLSGFSDFLKEQQVSENGQLILFDATPVVIARSEPTSEMGTISHKEHKSPVERYLLTKKDTRKQILSEGSVILPIEGTEYIIRLSAIGTGFGVNQYLVSAAPVSDFTGHIREMELRISGVTGIILLVMLPVVILISRKVSRSLMLLADEARKIQHFDFSESPRMDSAISEIHDLIKAFSIMKVTIRDRTDALIATQQKLEKLVDQGIALSSEQDIDTLVEMIFLAAKELASADGGILYLKEDDNRLHQEIFTIDSAGIAYGGSSGQPVPFNPFPLYHPETGEENHGNPVCHAFLTGTIIRTDSVYFSKTFDFSDFREFDKTTGYTTRNLLTVPLKPRQGDPLGVIQLINHRDSKTDKPVPFTHETSEFVEALAAQAAVSLDNRNLVIAQINLFNAFIQLMAGAIDAKSPYTGGHCARVPEIACLLAEAASEAKKPPFENFNLETFDEWHEFRVAAWLHDCGKVTTPEFVVDKSTKLETLYNRIHEIRTRFEIVLRDAEITYLKGLHAPGSDPFTLERAFEEEKRSIMEDFSFVASCNIGGEFMEEDAISRLHSIAKRSWTRHLDDRLGLSNDELKHLQAFPPAPLPCRESLIADKPSHIIRRMDYNGQTAIEGFNMTIPENLYNTGELYNLSIRKGTLTEEERFKINEHIIQTIIMLERLPFPKHLARVPEFAGAHHETMNGTGYPRKLTGDQMSIPARIMTIADIFEALTASDRPYKKGNTISRALSIMATMKDEQHIDPDLFDLFLTSGSYLSYAKRFLSPEQIDPVDIDRFLSKVDADAVS